MIINKSLLEQMKRTQKDFESFNKYKIEIHNQLFSMPKIDSSLSQMLEQQEKLTSALAFSMPKIDNSLFDSIKLVQSNLNAFNLNKIDISFIENTNKFIKEFKKINLNLQQFDLYNIDNNIEYYEINRISEKIEKGILLSKIDISKYWKFIEVLFILYSIYLTINPDNSEHIKTQQMIVNLERNISTLLKQDIYYEVTKQVHVRKYPNSIGKSKKLDIVFPKQKLLIVSKKSKWIEVEYFNEKNQETITGWVYKKYTKRLK